MRGPWYVWAVLLAVAAAQEPFTLNEFLTGQFSQRGFGATWISGNEIPPLTISIDYIGPFDRSMI